MEDGTQSVDLTELYNYLNSIEIKIDDLISVENGFTEQFDYINNRLDSVTICIMWTNIVLSLIVGILFVLVIKRR